LPQSSPSLDSTGEGDRGEGSVSRHEANPWIPRETGERDDPTFNDHSRTGVLMAVAGIGPGEMAAITIDTGS
jgi:hypothetical protein